MSRTHTASLSHFRHAAVAVLAALTLGVAAVSTAGAAPSTAALQKQVRTLKAQIKNQQRAITARNATIRRLTAEANGLRASLSATVTVAIGSMTAEEAWSLIPAIAARFPESDGTWSRSYSNFSGWESYGFTHTP